MLSQGNHSIPEKAERDIKVEMGNQRIKFLPRIRQDLRNFKEKKECPLTKEERTDTENSGFSREFEDESGYYHTIKTTTTAIS
ncbi:hypothetical protein NPIL_264021 [Nephila pilipes]|uniref:Uncharacterized protein n=1 Tax=Nephila pilipes TaxID=299642 RepID=A0A8X6PFT4_NEPPI|nr:hypothetical protein NPIL_264021 [Nephila pilipes]